MVCRYKLTGETGSYRYMAPEVFKSELCESFSGPLRLLKKSLFIIICRQHGIRALLPPLLFPWRSQQALQSQAACAYGSKPWHWHLRQTLMAFLFPVGTEPGFIADNAKVDVYAFSMILFELIEGKVRILCAFPLTVSAVVSQ